MAKKDPYEVDFDELRKLANENKGKSTAKICPKRNSSIGKSCSVCDYLVTHVYSQKYPDQHPASVFARDKKAKASVFMNVVFESDQTKSIILEVGSKVGFSIINNIENKKYWNTILNPKKGKGRGISISKTKAAGAKWVDYKEELDFDVADWEISKDVLDNMANLDQQNLIKMIENNELDDSNYMHIKSIKEGETLSFRVCPPWPSGNLGDNNKRPFEFVWRHWGVSDAQIAGTEQMDWKNSIEEETDDANEPAPWETNTPTEGKVPPKKEKPVKVEVVLPSCFGNPLYFEETDELTCLDRKSVV